MERGGKRRGGKERERGKKKIRKGGGGGDERAWGAMEEVGKRVSRSTVRRCPAAECWATNELGLEDDCQLPPRDAPDSGELSAGSPPLRKRPPRPHAPACEVGLREKKRSRESEGFRRESRAGRR